METIYVHIFRHINSGSIGDKQGNITSETEFLASRSTFSMYHTNQKSEYVSSYKYVSNEDGTALVTSLPRHRELDFS